MKKKKLIIGASALLCIVLVVAVIIIFGGGNNGSKNNLGLAQVKQSFESDIQELKDGKYANLVYKEFEASIEDVEGVYNLEIQTDKNYLDNTFLENFENMNESIDKFFQEDFDKSYIVADFTLSESDEETIYVNYNDIEEECADEKYNQPRTEFLFGNEVSNGGYMVQIAEDLRNAWFSRGEFGEIQPSEYTEVYRYISCKRQVDDVDINLKDKVTKLSEMEEKVLSFVNGDFALPVSEGISFGIGDARILSNGEYEGVCFKLRRVYKGIPFEYGANGSGGMYIDPMGHDGGEIDYAVSEYPDTMLTFGVVNGKVIETKEIEKMLSLGDALEILSQRIGENSVYDVDGVELVYRNCAIPEDREDELDDILAPKWKILTKNQNDDKYTYFFVDVVTGEVTERFEYSYD